jgi:hypothetical protein
MIEAGHLAPSVGSVMLGGTFNIHVFSALD